MRFTKTLLAAAALVTGTAVNSQAQSLLQVSRSGIGAGSSAFESDNSETLSSTFYNASFVGRVALSNFSPAPAGSVLRVGDIALGFTGIEDLTAKDGGWFDLRGDLTLGASGTIYIRDGEITANVYTQYYSPGTLNTLGTLDIEEGILSVRSHFAQDMTAGIDQTLGFRDGAVNNSRLLLTGVGYGVSLDGEGGPFLDPTSGYGALRAITGNNVQNGNVSVLSDGEGAGLGGPFDGALIGTDTGASLTINGSINGLNNLDSNGGAIIAFNSIGTTTVNGRILGGITDIYKVGAGELTLSASNLFSGDVNVIAGSLRVTHSGALSDSSGDTYVDSGASLVLDHPTGISLVDDIHIQGTGLADVGGAIHNKSGANSTTGDIWVSTPDGFDPVEDNTSATVTVAASSSLTVKDLRAEDSSNTNDIIVDVSGSDLTAGGFTVLGNTGEIDNFIKNGTGNATLTALAEDLDDIDVNAGKVLVMGSVDSSSTNIYDELDIDGILGMDDKPLGSLEIRGTHHYIELNVDMVDVLIAGSVTHHGGESNDLDITGNATVTVDTGATLTTEQNDDEDASADIEDKSTLVVKGTFQANGGSIIDLDDEATLDIRAGGVVNSAIITNEDSAVIIAAADGLVLGAGVLNGNVDAYNDATVTVNGVLNGNIITRERTDPEEGGSFSNVAITVAGTVNGNIVLRGDVQTESQPNPDSALPDEPPFIYSFKLDGDGNRIPVSTPGSFSTLSVLSGGKVNGDVSTYEYTTFTLGTGAVHNGDYSALGYSTITVNGTIDNDEGNPLGENFSLSGAATLKGSGTIGGNLTQTGGTVAPGNSVETLTVLGNYSISAGSLQIEIGGIAGAGIDPNGNDQLGVAGTVTVSGTSVLDFQPYNGFESSQGNPAFQIIATNLGAPRATIGTFNTVEMTGLNDRVLFDHSTGKAYGTGLSLSGKETFRDYGDNSNRREIGRALWMEAVARDNNSGVRDQNFLTPTTTDLLNPSGLKVFLLTRNASDLTVDPLDSDLTQVQTDLGRAAAMVLTASDVGAALDSLSPEVYVGFTELSTRLNRNFSLLGATGRRSGDEKKWGFNLGYSGEQLTSDGTSAYSSFKAGTNTAYLTADFALTAQTHLNLSLGSDDGSVRALGFDGDTDSFLAGIGISYTTDSSFARFDLGASFSTTDIRAVRQGGVMDQDDQDAHAVSLRVTFLPKDPPLKPVVAGKAPEAPRLSWIPYVGLSFGSTSIDSFVEAESFGTAQLGVLGFDRDSFIGELGLGMEYALGANTTLTGIVAYEHEFNSKGETDLVAGFVEDGVDDTLFGIRSDGIGTGLFRIGLGIRQKFSDTTSFGLSYDALMGGGIGSGHHLKADVSFRF